MTKIDVDCSNTSTVESLGFTDSCSWNTLIVLEGSTETCPTLDRLFLTRGWLPAHHKTTDLTCKASILSTINYTVLELTSLFLEELDT